MFRTPWTQHRLIARPSRDLGRRSAHRRRVALVWGLESLEGRTLLSAGDLDPTFGVGGLVATHFGPSDTFVQAYSLVMQPDGKLVAAGTSNDKDFALSRYNADGSLDQSFGVGGTLTTTFGPSAHNQWVRSLVLQPDGKLVAAGTSSERFALARYNADGSLDQSFGVGGTLTTTFGPGTIRSEATSLVIQPDGKLVAAGYNENSSTSNFTLARYNADGSLDQSFGQGGLVTTDFVGATADSAQSLVLQPDGKLVAAGSTYTPATNDSDFALARYNGDGSLDTSFGVGGTLTTSFGQGVSLSDAHSLVLQPDGKLVAAGYTYNPAIGTDFALARYNANGGLDQSFGVGGTLTTSFGQGVSNAAVDSLVLQPDGKLVAAGISAPTGNVDFALARYNADGGLDQSFGVGGTLTTNFGPGNTYEEAYSLVLQPDGKLVAAGLTDFDFALARYEGDSAPQGNPPTADAGGPYSIHEGDSLSLDAAASNDPDGDPLTYSWDVNGDGHFGDATGVQPTLSWAQLQALGITDSGTYSVKVRVNDGHGHSVTSSAVALNIANTAPTAAITGAPASGPEGHSIVLTASVTDPSNADTNAGFVYAWTVTRDGSPYATGSGRSLTFTPDDNGTYVVHLTATDQDGDGGGDERTITVTNVAPTATLTNNGPVLFDNPVTVSFTGPFDPSSADTAASFHYAFATSVAALAGATYANSGTASSASFTFAAAGSHAVYGRILDKDGGHHDYATTVVVTNQPAPAVVQTIINGGQVQRSNIESIAVRFSEDTNLPQLLADGRITQAVQVVGPAGVVALDAARYIYDAKTLTLAIDLTIDGFGGSARTMLGDGRYQLRLSTSLITAAGDSTSKLLDTDGTADGVVRSDFFRLLGDLNGDAQINATDVVLERNMVLGFGGAVPGIAGDIDGDGDVDLADYNALRQRVGKKLPPA